MNQELRRWSLCIAAALIASLGLCGCTDSDPADGAPTNLDSGNAESIAVPTPTVLRLLSGDATAIDASSWIASEAGDHYSVVTDGQPMRPWISSAHVFGTKSIAFQVPTETQESTETAEHKQRVEYKISKASDPDGLHFDNARYSGFAFKLGAAPAPFLSSALFWQAWQGAPYGPPVSLKFAADAAAPFRIKLSIRNMSTGPSSIDPDLDLWSTTIIAPDTWHTFLIYVEPRYDGTGHLKLWIDGVKVFEWAGEIGYDPTKVMGAYNGLDTKNGIYQPTKNNGHTFYFDQIVFASTYAAAAAALGW